MIIGRLSFPKVVFNRIFINYQNRALESISREAVLIYNIFTQGSENRSVINFENKQYLKQLTFLVSDKFQLKLLLRF